MSYPAVLLHRSPRSGVGRVSWPPTRPARALISPAGFIRFRVDPKLALESAVWLLWPTAEHTRRMLRLFVAPGADPPETEVEWMVLMAACCRTPRLSCPPKYWPVAPKRPVSSGSENMTDSCHRIDCPWQCVEP